MDEIIKPNKDPISSSYSIRLALPNHVTIVECQRILDDIFKHRIVKDAMFVIESSQKVERLLLKGHPINLEEKPSQE